MFHKNLWINNRWCWRFKFSYTNCNLVEHSLNYSETTGSLWFYSKDERTIFNTSIENIEHFNSFKYKAKLIGNTVDKGANGILKNAIIAALLKYLSSLWRSFKMPLINWNIESKLKWKKYCVLPWAGNENDINNNDNANNIIFTINGAKLFVPVVTLSARDNQKLSKLLRKEFGRPFYWNEYKTISENKNTTN